MKRPHLIHFLSITTNEFINIKALVALKECSGDPVDDNAPIHALPLLGSGKFHMKIIGIDERHNTLYEKVFESDPYGAFYFKISLNDQRRRITTLQVYEVAQYAGLELFLGSYRPILITSPKKLLISDFDKTLVDTKYSTIREIYHSLTRPITHFPTIKKSLTLLKDAIKRGHHPFILSASPHFYENAIRDWLYRHQVYTASVFLKDYRQVFGLLESKLTPKDLKAHGLYKMNQLLDVLLMTGIPDDLILMGDNFESDPLIYAALEQLLFRRMKPWELWQLLKDQRAFRMNTKQDNQILSKIYQLENLLKNFYDRGKNPRLTILIRKRDNADCVNLPGQFSQTMDCLQSY